jgi:eukaryotic-like serine/threonine-protein kinase
VLYFARCTDPVRSATYVQDLGSSQRVLVMRSPLRAAFARPSYLLLAQSGALSAQRLNLNTYQLAGNPMPVAADVSFNLANGPTSFAASDNGVLIYREEPRHNAQLVWMGRDGKRLGTIGKSGEFGSVRLSPDEKTAALSVGALARGDLWLLDLATGDLKELTRDHAVSSQLGPWSANSQRMALNRNTTESLKELTVASGEERLLDTSGARAFEWTPDGRSLLAANATDGLELKAIPREKGAKPTTVYSTPNRKSGFRLSPDGKFIAYSSFESGHNQIYVASYPSFSSRRQVSIDSGNAPTWRGDGKELFFLADDGMLMRSAIAAAAQIDAGLPTPMFRVAPSVLNSFTYAPSRNGQRFLVIERDTKGSGSQTVVTLNWTAVLR